MREREFILILLQRSLHKVDDTVERKELLTETSRQVDEFLEVTGIELTAPVEVILAAASGWIAHKRVKL